MAGTRPAGPIAAAWAAMMHIGRAGLPRAHPRGARRGACSCAPASRAIDALEVRGDPPATVLAFGARDPDALDIFAVGERLAAERLVSRPPEPARLAPRHRARRQCRHGAGAGGRPASGRSPRSGSTRTDQRDTTYGTSADLAGLHRRAGRRSTRSSPRPAGRTARADGPRRGSASSRAVGRRVTAVDLAARQAEAQVHPAVAGLHALTAPLGGQRRHVV